LFSYLEKSWELRPRVVRSPGLGGLRQDLKGGDGLGTLQPNVANSFSSSSTLFGRIS